MVEFEVGDKVVPVSHTFIGKVTKVDSNGQVTVYWPNGIEDVVTSLIKLQKVEAKSSNTNPFDSHLNNPREMEQRVLGALLSIVSDMAEILEGECRLDHHGYCQEHGWMKIDPPCPYSRWKLIKSMGAGRLD